MLGRSLLLPARTLCVLSTCLMVALTACGGGGGGSPAPAAPAPAPSPAPAPAPSPAPNPAPPPDSEPDAFSIAPVENVQRGVQVTSTSITISGIDTAATVSIAGGEYAVNGGIFTSDPGSVNNSATILVRVISSSLPGGTVETTLTVGGSAANFIVTSSLDVTPPTVSVAFPTAQSRISADRVIVRGTANDTENGVRFVRVNGVEAVSTDAFATWTASVPLALGSNTLHVAVEDRVGNSSSAIPRAITRNAMVGEIEGLAVHAAGGSVLASDAGGGVLLSIDVATGLRTVIATDDPFTPTNRLRLPNSVVIETNGTHALLFDRGGPPAIMRVELATGARTLVSGRGFPNTQNELNNASWLSVDLPNGKAYVLTFAPAAIYSVDLGTGVRTVLSDSTTPSTANMFPSPVSMTLDTIHNRLLVGDQGGAGPANHAIYAVSLDTGARTIVSSNTIPDGNNPLTRVAALTVDAPRNRALAVQSQTGSIMAVDLTTGARTVFSGPAFPTAENAFERPRAIALDPSGNRAFVADSGTRALLAVDLATGARTLVSANEPADIGARQTSSRGIAVDIAANRAYVTDPFARLVNAVDLSTGNRTVVSTSGALWNFPGAVAIDASRNRLVVVDQIDDAVYAVDLTTGFCTILSSNSMPGSGVALVDPASLAMDMNRNRALVTDRSLEAVVAVDLTSGSRTLLSSPAVPPGGGATLASPNAIAIDAAANRALVSVTSASIVAVDLDAGTRTTFSSGLPGGASAIGIDASTRSIVFGIVGVGLFVANPDSGVVTLAVAETRPRADDRPRPHGLAIDGARRIAWATSEAYAIPHIIDLVTGERVFLTR